jgi:hypothetical protein
MSKGTIKIFANAYANARAKARIDIRLVFMYNGSKFKHGGTQVAVTARLRSRRIICGSHYQKIVKKRRRLK